MKVFLFCGCFLFASLAMAGGKSCTYQFNKEGTELLFTAYKFTEKAPVSGTFTDIQYEAEAERTLQEAAESLEVEIDTLTVDTKDTGRNANIVAGFFKQTAAPHRIKADIERMGKGKAQVEFKWNGVRRILPMDYIIDEKAGTVTFTGTGTMDAFALGKAYARIKELCKALHTGKDGKSVTWPDFALKLVAKFEKACG